mmetsp:Transcript_84743/g.230029  ORF Transcript_84743/g.230029 Transcript_84743/m.230029 type:complete len:108 (-) Transcript_84743:7-330(-)
MAPGMQMTGEPVLPVLMTRKLRPLASTIFEEAAAEATARHLNRPAGAAASTTVREVTCWLSLATLLIATAAISLERGAVGANASAAAGVTLGERRQARQRTRGRATA